MASEHYNVLIVGAGLSGVGAACCLQKTCPGKSYAILESRDNLGGTWDLFRYPGVRSDSDMFTLSYSFRPWPHAKTIAGGRAIRNYIRDTARVHAVDRKIRYNTRVRAASWSSEEARWTIEAERGADGERIRLTCDFLWMCAGYFCYDRAYLPEFPGMDQFRGQIVHPQNWSADVAYAGKRVVVIGSGATAVTIVPELARRAAHVVMLQRSPTYVIGRPSTDAVADAMRATLPAKMAYRLARWRNILLGAYFYWFCRSSPQNARQLLHRHVRAALGSDAGLASHFAPRYNPWEQRLCVAPDGDLFEAIRSGRASVVTDHIESFTPTGLRLKSGGEIEADLVVAATGLVLQPLGGVGLSVDGGVVDLGKAMVYKGVMFAGVPNLASVFGYINASWTLKAELISCYVCRILCHMEAHGYRQCVPRNEDPEVVSLPLVDLSSGLYLRALDCMPKQGSKPPWRSWNNYPRDLLTLKFQPLEDGALCFSGTAPAGHTACEPRRAAR